VLNQYSQVEKIEENCTWSDEYMGQETRVNLSQITREETVFGNQFALLEFSIHQRDIAILIEFCAAEAKLVGGLEDTSGGLIVVQETCERWEISRSIGRRISSSQSEKGP
jgi:hypothetical protein